MTDDLPTPDAEPICLECFHQGHEGVCPECGVPCAVGRRQRLMVGAVRIAFSIVVLLLFFVVIALAMSAFYYGLAWLPKVAPWTVVPIALMALWLRWRKSQMLAASLDAEAVERAKGKATPGRRAGERSQR